jgi:multicomponent Na+:H+ antiporter subunit B
MKQKDIEQIIHDDSTGMSLIVKTVARMMIAVIILFAFYIILYGHLTPGGGFAGGVIFAIAYTLMMLAFSRKMALHKFSDFWASFWDNVGMLSFIVLAFLGLNGGYFLYNFIWHGEPFHLVSAGIIPLANIAIGVKVGACLYAIFIGLSIYGRLIIKEEE